MKRPRFTDNDRFHVPYVGSAGTNISATFKRIRADLKAEAEASAAEASAQKSIDDAVREEALRKMIPLPKKATA